MARSPPHMATVRTLAGNDLGARVSSRSSGHQRGAVPSSELEPLQFPRVRPAFKQEALNRSLKLNRLFELYFSNFMKE
jgi:hypothetical protein